MVGRGPSPAEGSSVSNACPWIGLVVTKTTLDDGAAALDAALGGVGTWVAQGGVLPLSRGGFEASSPASSIRSWATRARIEALSLLAGPV